MKKLVLSLVFLVFCAFAETSVYGTENRFMFSSPRHFSLGEASTAISDEPIPANNPATISLADHSNAFLGFTGFWGNILWAGNTYGTFVIDSLNTASLFVGYLNIPNIDSVRAYVPFSGADTVFHISMETASELNISFNFARKFINTPRLNLSAGLALNMMRRRLIDWTGYGIGLDLGVLLTTDRGNHVSFQIDNITTQYTRWSSDFHENVLPQAFLAYAWSRQINENFGLSLMYRSPDLFGNSGVVSSTWGSNNNFEDDIRSGSIIENPQNIFTAAGYGAEFSIRQIVSLRLGLTSTQKLTFGGGVRLFERANVDFAYFYSSALSGTYSISLRLDL